LTGKKCPMTPDDALSKAYQTSKTISYALAASMLLYAGIVEALKFQEVTVHLFPPASLDKLRFVFVFLSFAAYFIINFVNQKILTKKSADTTATLLGKLALANVISLALCELPALFGLLLFLSSGNSRDFYLLLIISVLLFFAFFPRYSFWSNWSRVIDKTALS
jgi:hypothetical protein